MHETAREGVEALRRRRSERAQTANDEQDGAQAKGGDEERRPRRTRHISDNGAAGHPPVLRSRASSQQQRRLSGRGSADGDDAEGDVTAGVPTSATRDEERRARMGETGEPARMAPSTRLCRDDWVVVASAG